MIKKVLTVKNDAERATLRLPCTEFDVANEDALLNLAKDLVDTIAAAGVNAVGLAANQIDRTVCVFAMRWNSKIIVIVNPVVVKVSEQKVSSREGCLSHPGLSPIRAKRHKRISIPYYDIEQKKIVKQKFHSLDAIVVQHEMDHLKGIIV